MKLINEQSSEANSVGSSASSKAFKKIPMDKIDNIENPTLHHKPDLKKNNEQHIENSTSINNYYKYHV
jgi:hypothetical protein